VQVNAGTLGARAKSRCTTQSEIRSQISDSLFLKKTLQDGRAFILQNPRSDLAAVVKHLRLQ
jgi:hypothetical protein